MSQVGPQDPTPKPWGWSTRVFCNDMLQLERILIRAGGYSSIHLHDCKWNQFLVNTGDLSVLVFGENLKLLDTFDIGPGDHYVVEPLVRHQFVARSEVEGYEVYWPSDPLVPLDPNDIRRFSANGLDRSWEKRQPNVEYACCCECNGTHRVAEMVTVCVENALRTMCRECVSSTNAKPYGTMAN